MGISLIYRRVSPDQLRHLRTSQSEELLLAHMSHDRPIFPMFSEHIIQEDESQFCDLEKLYPLVEGFLNPNHEEASVFFHAFHHGKPIIDHAFHAHDDYLGVVYFLVPDQVQSMTQAMDDIPQEAWIERYRLLMEDSSIEEARARTEFPTYDDVIDLFLDFRRFFQQAADAGEGILRWYA
jgi:uncharacterized protein DUF1877